jgi:hypothetical protein
MRKIGLPVIVACALALVPAIASANAVADLTKIKAAFLALKSWHATEQFSNGRTITVDHVAPDRWRIQPAPNITELLIGNSVYMVRNGKTMHVPIPGGMLQKTIDSFYVAPPDNENKQTARDLGMQTINGQTLHAYSFTTHGTPVTMYVGSDLLPVVSVVKDPKVTTTITYSDYNDPINISP